MVLWVYFILNASGQTGSRVGMVSTLGSNCRCGLWDGVGQLLNTLVDCLLVVYHDSRVHSGTADSPGVCLPRKPGMSHSACVRSRGWGVRPIDQAGDSVGRVMQEPTLGCDQPRIPLRVIRVEISRYQE
jgi:hypothetical protein